MNPAQLFSQFDRLSDAPDAIPRLRRFILDLAVRGKLVEQDSKDEPASELLSRIQAEKVRSISEGRARKSKDSLVLGDIPFNAPADWEWVPFGEIVRIRTGKLDANAAVKGGAYPFFTCSQTPSEIDSYSFDTSAVLLAGNGDFNLKCYQGKFDAYQRTYVIEPLGWDLQFCFILMKSQISRITENQRGSAIPYLKLADIADPLVPLPPLAEQQRIVDKVDELMALCDRLEAAQAERENRRHRLVASSLNRLSNGADLDAFRDHARFYFDHLPSLTTKPDHIQQLRQTILTLAIQGKLVTQDPNDERAEKLLIKAEQKKRKWVGPIEEQEVPFKLPSSWQWVRLGDISSLKHGYAFSSEFFTSEPAPFVLTTPGNFYERGGFRDRESKRKYYSGPVDPEFIFKPGDLIIPMTEQAAGLLGSPAFIPDDGRVYVHNQRLGKLSFSESIEPEFAFWFFNSEFFRGELARTCTGMKVRHTSPDRVLKVLFPLPPLAEQQPIIAKVDELMAVCDRLEAELTTTQTESRRLLEAVLHEALAPAV